MRIEENGYVFSDDKAMIDLDSVCDLMKQTYWAGDKDKETLRRAIENSMCWGAYKDGLMVGFARVVTDNATMFWLADVIIDEKHRGSGLGKRLTDLAVNDEKIKDLFGVLATRDAQGLYEKFGFTVNPTMYMSRRKG